jgi:hypothetical protein
MHSILAMMRVIFTAYLLNVFIYESYSAFGPFLTKKLVDLLAITVHKLVQPVDPVRPCQAAYLRITLHCISFHFI